MVIVPELAGYSIILRVISNLGRSRTGAAPGTTPDCRALVRPDRRRLFPKVHAAFPEGLQYLFAARLAVVIGDVDPILRGDIEVDDPRQGLEDRTDPRGGASGRAAGTFYLKGLLGRGNGQGRSDPQNPQDGYPDQELLYRHLHLSVPFFPAGPSGHSLLPSPGRAPGISSPPRWRPV